MNLAELRDIRLSSCSCECIKEILLTGLNKARDIVFELNTSLNMEKGGRIAQNLRSLYNFIWRYLGDANLKNDAAMIDKVIGMLDDLSGAWRKISL